MLASIITLIICEELHSEICSLIIFQWVVIFIPLLLSSHWRVCEHVKRERDSVSLKWKIYLGLSSFYVDQYLDKSGLRKMLLYSCSFTEIGKIDQVEWGSHFLHCSTWLKMLFHLLPQRVKTWYYLQIHASSWFSFYSEDLSILGLEPLQSWLPLSPDRTKHP